jgi:hypothetical protein
MSRVNRGRGGYYTWELIGLANQTAKDSHMRCRERAEAVPGVDGSARGE